MVIINVKNTLSTSIELELEPDAEYLEISGGEFFCIKYKHIRDNDTSVFSFEITKNGLLIDKRFDFYVKIFKKDNELDYIGDEI